jgi:hypothetical protein
MATASTLIVRIQGDNASLKRSLSESKGQVNDFSNSSVSSFKKIGVALAAAFAVGAIISQIRSLSATISDTANQIDDMAKASGRMQLTIDNFQSLKFAAELSGLGMHRMERGFIRMFQAMEKGRKGNIDVLDAFNKLGISLDQIRHLSPDQQFRRIAEGFSRIRDRSDQLQVSLQIFGSRGGGQMLNLLNSNIAETEKRFEKFGVTLTASQAKAVESFNDTRKALGAIWGGLKQQITAQVAPAFDIILKHIEETIVSMGGLGPIATQMASTIVSGAIAVVSAVESMVGAYKLFQNTIDSTALAADSFFKAIPGSSSWRSSCSKSCGNVSG